MGCLKPKAMTHTEMINKLNELYKRRKTLKAYKTALVCLQAPGFWMPCGENKGSGRWATSESWSYETEIALRSVGAQFETRNVAPKGGKCGDQIRVIHFSTPNN